MAIPIMSPSISKIVVKAKVAYITAFGAFDMAITRTKAKTIAKIAIRTIQGIALAKFGNSDKPLKLEEFDFCEWNLFK